MLKMIKKKINEESIASDEQNIESEIFQLK
jgi:hypothetical protein